jgi:hypothetical protein
MLKMQFVAWTEEQYVVDEHALNYPQENHLVGIVGHHEEVGFIQMIAKKIQVAMNVVIAVIMLEIAVVTDAVEDAGAEVAAVQEEAQENLELDQEVIQEVVHVIVLIVIEIVNVIVAVVQNQENARIVETANQRASPQNALTVEVTASQKASPTPDHVPGIVLAVIRGKMVTIK